MGESAMVFETVKKGYDITLYKSAQLYIPARTAAKYFSQQPLVKLEYNRRTRKVRLTPTSQAGEDTWALRSQTHNSKALNFGILFKKYNIRLQGNVVASLKEQNGSLIFRIPNAQ
jgi:hypothetical protein